VISLKTLAPVLLSTVLLAGACLEPPPDPTVLDSSPSATRSEVWSGTVTFEGILPCASCPGIQTELQLKDDATFVLLSTYLEAEEGSDRTFADIGRWALTVDGTVLILRTGSSDTRRFRVAAADTLHMLSQDGQPIDSDLSYVLTRIDTERHHSPTLQLTGMYRYMADAALFEECRTRTRYPVVFEEAHIELERAYLGAREQAGTPVFASFEGRLEMRPRVEQGGEREFVVVSRFDSVDPEATCHENNLPLQGTNWTLTELDGLEVSVDDLQRSPHLSFDEAEERLAGSGTCNRFTGAYSVLGDSLGMGPLAATMMACPDMVDEETRFFQVLERADRFDLFGPYLELWLGDRLLARFEGDSAQRTEP
jgi:copper homeostasis protein (lipoprotein)